LDGLISQKLTAVLFKVCLGGAEQQTRLEEGGNAAGGGEAGGGHRGGGPGPRAVMIQPDAAAALQEQQWKIEVVKGRLTTRCFWNACKAFTVGMALMVVGTAMATVGKRHATTTD